MNNLYLCGDLHQEYIPHLFRRVDNTDTIIFLGDFGANFFLNGNPHETKFKKDMNNIGCKMIALRGNHESRLHQVSDIKKDQLGYYYEKKYPNLKYFSDEPSVYYINGYKCLILPGAYSIDKYYRLHKKLIWFKDEQMTEKEMDKARALIKENESFDLILSHTCPYSLRPVDLFMQGIDQSMVDNSMEYFFDEVRATASYKLWAWGHFHADRDYGFDETGSRHIMLFNNKLINIKEILGD